MHRLICNKILFGGPLKLKTLHVPLLLLKEEPFEPLQIQILTHDDVKGDGYKSIAYLYETATGQVMKTWFN